MALTQDEKLNRIETEAVRLFAEKGVGGASVAEIAEGAGVSQGYLYRHWKDKEAMARDLFRRRYVAFRDRLEVVTRVAAVPGQPSTRDRIAAMLHEGLRIYAEDPDGFRFLVLTQHQHLGRIESGGRTLVDVVRDVVTEGIDNGEIGVADPSIATAVVLGIFLQNATFDLYGDLAKPLSDVGDLLADACWRAIDGKVD